MRPFSEFCFTRQILLLSDPLRRLRRDFREAATDEHRLEQASRLCLASSLASSI